MYLENKENYSALEVLKEPIIETTINNVKEKLNGIDLYRFNGTPDHLERLLREGHTLSDTPHTFLQKGFLELQKNETVLLDGKISVYFSLEVDDNEKISKIYIFTGKIKQEISPLNHYRLYLHFINIYNKLIS